MTVLRALLTMAVAAALSACGGRGGELVLRVGLVAPLTGPSNDIGAGALEGAELALEALEASGGLKIADRPVRVDLVLRDAQSKPERAVRAAQELINKEGVCALIGSPLSAQAIPMALLAERAGVPMITQIATHPDVTRGRVGVFRMCFADDVQAEALVRFARERLSLARAAVLYDVASPMTRGMAEMFRRGLEERGGRIVAFEGYTSGETDFRAALARIKGAQPEALFLPGYVYDARLQIPQMRALGLKVQLLGCDTMAFRNADDLGLVEGAYFTTHFSDENPAEAVRQFVASYEAEFQRRPSSTAPLTYDAMGFLFGAVRRAQSVDARKIARALAEPVRYEGVTGIAQFAGRPDPAKSVVIVQSRSGQARFVAQIDPQ
jgi:branched-chain amino acid transport system substrate-binding protein